MTELKLWYRIGTRSRRALLREKKSFGRPYYYRPRGDLLARLARETGMTYNELFDQLQKERMELLRDRSLG